MNARLLPALRDYRFRHLDDRVPVHLVRRVPRDATLHIPATFMPFLTTPMYFTSHRADNVLLGFLQRDYAEEVARDQAPFPHATHEVDACDSLLDAKELAARCRMPLVVLLANERTPSPPDLFYYRPIGHITLPK